MHVAREERRADLAFEITDPPSHGVDRETQSLGGRAKAAAADDFEKDSRRIPIPEIGERGFGKYRFRKCRFSKLRFGETRLRRTPLAGRCFERGRIRDARMIDRRFRSGCRLAFLLRNALFLRNTHTSPFRLLDYR